MQALYGLHEKKLFNRIPVIDSPLSNPYLIRAGGEIRNINFRAIESKAMNKITDGRKLTQ